MPRLSRRLLLLPLLLLAPLGVLKWRADWIQEHPPLSKMDERFRAALSKADMVTIVGAGGIWNKVTRLPNDKSVVVRDRRVFADLMQTLRLSDQPSSLNAPDNFDSIALKVLSRTDHTTVAFGYFWSLDGRGSYVSYFDNDALEQERVKVPSRFGPRFEALIAQLAQRAKAKGKHPEIVISTPPLS